MKHTTHDPYLNTARRSLQDKLYKKRIREAKKDISQQNRPKGFLNQKINIMDYIKLNISNGPLKTMLILILIVLPYGIGIVFTFLVIARANINVFNSINIDDKYLIYWSIGYEVIAFASLILIIKKAISFYFVGK